MKLPCSIGVGKTEALGINGVCRKKGRNLETWWRLFKELPMTGDLFQKSSHPSKPSPFRAGTNGWEMCSHMVSLGFHKERLWDTV